MSDDGRPPCPPDETSEALYSVESWTMDESLGYLLSTVKGQLIARIDAELAPLDITWAQWATILKMASGKARTATELCRHSGCDTGSMTRMVDRLEQKGLVRRERGVEDRRMVFLHLTEKGQQLVPELKPIAVTVLNHFLRGFSREELELFKSFLRRMIANGDPD